MFGTPLKILEVRQIVKITSELPLESLITLKEVEQIKSM